eukprot:969759-Karenia_brevis.AAC.1
MQHQQLNPRTLADDLMLTTDAATPHENTLTTFARGFTDTMIHLGDMGGRIAPTKSKLFATRPGHRDWLARYTWNPINTTIEVVHQMRDLGSQLVLGGK